MSWKEEYRQKLVTAEEAVGVVKSGDKVSFGGGTEPRTLAKALAARKDELAGVKLNMALPTRDFGWLQPGWESSFALQLTMPGPVAYKAIRDKRCDLEVGFIIPSIGAEDTDVLLCQVTPPDEHGYCSFGPARLNQKEMVRDAKTVVATSVGGGDIEDLKFINNNPIVELYSIDYVDNPLVIAKHDNMVAINQALSVDLGGQIASESIGFHTWSAAGGQPAFSAGACLSKGGRNITVLRSTAKQGTISCIVPAFEPGTIVTVPRTMADIIVTEYGVARLRGKTQRQRAEELIAIAHPYFSGWLKDEARRLY